MSLHRITTIVLLFLTACAHSVGVIVVGGDRTLAATEHAIKLGVPVEITDEDDGPTIYVVEVESITYKPPTVRGVSLQQHGCERVVLVERTGTKNVNAHELGHALSLNHSDDPGNLMSPNVPHELRSTFSKRQIDKMNRHAEHIMRVCP